MPKFEGYFPCPTKTITGHATSAYAQTRSGNTAGDNKNTRAQLSYENLLKPKKWYFLDFSFT